MKPKLEKLPYRVPFDNTFILSEAPTAPPEDAPGKKHLGKELDDLVNGLDHLQRLLYAHNRYALLLIFQAMDAAGKDSTIRAVFSGVNPAGCQVFSFKQPSAEELDHDFLWRSARRLPERGRIGVFNRSYYEEVLVVRVHPEFLDKQRLPREVRPSDLWTERYESIREHERHLDRNGTTVIKFFLNVSREEQRERFLARIDEPKKNWKFAASDVEERARWDEYMKAYEDALNATSRPWAPWYAIPADSKPFMRWQVARIIRDTMAGLDMSYPAVDPKARRQLEDYRDSLDEN